MAVRCLPSAKLKGEEEKRDTSRDRGPRAGALFLFLFDIQFPASCAVRRPSTSKFTEPLATFPQRLRRKEDGMSQTGTVGRFEARNMESENLHTKSAVGTHTTLGLFWFVYVIARVLL